MSDFSDQIHRVLATDPASVAKWERAAFDELAGEKKERLVLCGAGGLGRKTLAGLRRVGIEPLAFADNNPALAGKSIEGVPVYSATEAVKKFGADSAFIVTIWGAHSPDRLAHRKQQWRDLGCETVISFMPLFWKFAEIFLPHYTCDLPHKVFDQARRIEALADLWSDDFSRAEFVAQLRWRCELDFDALPEPVAGPSYFPQELFALRLDEYFVDCGAYDGDTLGDFLRFSGGEFEKFWALEPDPANFEKLKKVVAGLDADRQKRIALLKVAASDRAQTLRFSADATASSAVMKQGGIEVEGRPLDSLLAGTDPTFIKMDIEGAELSALLGARQLLGRCRPILAICVYHLQEHLWEIPEWLAGLLSDYTFHLRPHDREGWDLVCYAVPIERSLSLDTGKHLPKHPQLMSSLDFPPRACPICTSQSKHLLFPQRFGTLSEGSLLAGYDLVICDQCGFAFSDRIPDQSVFDRHYAEMSKYEYAHREGAESEFDAARFTQIAAYLAGELPDRKCRILDIGCATAGQLAKLRALGYESVTGLDPSPACAVLAKKFYGIEVFTGTLFENNLPEHAFDLIILVGVLEHVRDVAEAIAKLGECLSANGMIFAEVPDATAFADWPDAPYQEFSIEHINFFGPKPLENLMRAAGYELVKMDRPPRQFTKTTVMPSAAGLFRRTAAKLPLEKDAESEQKLRDYIRQSAAEEKRVSALIDAIVQSGERVVVWGVGTHTLHLMETTNFAKANIAAFVDVNTKYHGKELFGRPVIAPEAMAQRSEPILISSRAFQNDIAGMIRHELKFPNRFILLYEEISS